MEAAIRRHGLRQPGVMELGAPSQTCIDERNADAAAEIAGLVEQGRSLAVTVRRHADISRRVGRNEQERQGAHLHRPVEGDVVERGVRRQPRLQEQPVADHDEAADQQPFWWHKAAANEANRRHDQNRAEAAGKQGKTGGLRVIAKQRLGELREQLDRAQQDEADKEQQGAADSEVADLEQPDVDHWTRMVPFPHREQAERDGRDGEQAEDERGGEAVILLELIEKHLQGAKTKRHQTEPQIVELQALAQQLFAVFDQCFRLTHENRNQHKGDQPDRQVNQENPVPGEVIGEPAADQRAGGGGDDDCQTV